MSNWHVDSSAAGLNNGTSRINAWQSFSDIDQTGLSAGDVIYIYPGTGAYHERYSLTKGGAASSLRLTYKGVDLPSLWGILGNAIDNVAIIGCQITQATGVSYEAIRMAGCSGWLVQDNYIHNTYSAAVNGTFGTTNSNNIIRSNTFHNICSVSGGKGNVPVIVMYGNSNLIEYNITTSGLDRVRVFGTGNVVRNNYFGPTDSVLYPNTDPYPHHIDAFQSFEAPIMLNKLLFERNWDIDNRDSAIGGGTNAHHIIIQDGATQGLNWCVSRFNVLIRPGGPAYILQDFDQMYGYNLTSIGVYSGSTSVFNNAVVYEAPVSDIQDWRNNTWSYSPRTVDSRGIFGTGITTVSRFTGNYQHRYDAGVLPLSTHNVPNTDPLFLNPATDDYRLQPSSILIGSGGPITYASGAGTNATTLWVDSARGIFDGWGIADADFIKIGAGSFVQVSGIDYDTNSVTLTAARSWSDRDWIQIKGMEDIGALPYAYVSGIQLTNTTSTLAAGTVTLSATTNTPNAIRKIEFLVDGLPVGESYSSPYETTWVSDGLAHTVEARAYNMWASSITGLYTSGLWTSTVKVFRRLGRQPKFCGQSL